MSSIVDNGYNTLERPMESCILYKVILMIVSWTS